MDYFTTLELQQLKTKLGQDRDSLLLKLAVVTGARESELILITKECLNIEDCTVFIKATKNSDDRVIKIDRALMCSLQQLETKADGRLFPISTSRVRQIWYAMRPASITKRFHCFRHTFGIELYKVSRDIMFVKKAMGHKSIHSTMVYVECVNYNEQFDKHCESMSALLG